MKFWTGKVGPVRLLDCYRTILRTRRPRHLTSYRARYARTAISGNGWRWTASGNANREQPVNSVKIGGHEGRSKPQKAQRLCSHPAGRRCQRWIWQRRHLHWMSLPTTDHSVPCHVLSHLQSICFDFPVCIWSCFCRATAANMLWDSSILLSSTRSGRRSALTVDAFPTSAHPGQLYVYNVRLTACVLSSEGFVRHLLIQVDALPARGHVVEETRGSGCCHYCLTASSSGLVPRL